jgi:hypothetical protein
VRGELTKKVEAEAEPKKRKTPKATSGRREPPKAKAIK